MARRLQVSGLVVLGLRRRNEAASGSALDDEKFVEPAFQGAVEERNAFGWGQADQFWYAGVARQHVDAPSGEPLLQPIAKLGVERLEFVRLAEAESIRRVDHHNAFVGRRVELEDIALF